MKKRKLLESIESPIQTQIPNPTPTPSVNPTPLPNQMPSNPTVSTPLQNQIPINPSVSTLFYKNIFYRIISVFKIFNVDFLRSLIKGGYYNTKIYLIDNKILKYSLKILKVMFHIFIY
jgi:hypothetical protein